LTLHRPCHGNVLPDPVPHVGFKPTASGSRATTERLIQLRTEERIKSEPTGLGRQSTVRRWPDPRPFADCRDACTTVGVDDAPQGLTMTTPLRLADRITALVGSVDLSGSRRSFRR
jgi:hypothetical protein